MKDTQCTHTDQVQTAPSVQNHKQFSSTFIEPTPLVHPNALAGEVTTEIGPIIDQMFDGCADFISYSSPDGLRNDRPATDRECCQFSLNIAFSADVDARRDITKQTRKWIRKCVQKLTALHAHLKMVTDAGLEDRKDLVQPLAEPPVAIGQEIEFYYPKHPFHGIKLEYTRRRIRVTRLRNMSIDPDAGREINEEPLLLRGRWEVVGVEVATGEPYSFFPNFASGLRIVGEAKSEPARPDLLAIYFVGDYVTMSRHEAEGYAQTRAYVHQETVEIRTLTIPMAALLQIGGEA